MNVSLVPLVLTGALLSSGAQTATQVSQRIHPYLREQIADAEPNEVLPVYFEMRDKLRYEDFAPAILRMDKETRRESVVSQLQAHMNATQRDLMAFLNDRGFEIVSRNWLGNFVRVNMPASSIVSAAAIDGVSEVWFDHAPELGQVEDGAPAPPRRTPGNGPLDTRAFEVWATGVRGDGVVWMNSDSGVRASHTNLSSIHPGLAGQLWTNPGEVFDNGVDDDGNGKVDDYYGWNFGGNNNNVEDSGGHGTNCAGVFVGFDAANESRLGNCPNAKVMTGKLSGESSQWDAVQYAIEMGAHGQTSSHSYKNNFNPPPNYGMHRDVAEASMAAGLIRTNSTSNNGGACGGTSTIARPFNISAPGCLPSPWIHPDQTLVGRLGGVLGIGAHNVGSPGPSQPSYTPCGPFAWFLPDLQAVLPSYPHAWDPDDNDYPWMGGSAMALLKPDLTGPTGTRTTSGQTGYTIFSGTSNATPSVSSCLALALSANLSLTPEDMAMAVQTTAIDYGSPGKDNLSGAGKVDAWELTKMCRNVHRVNGSVAHTTEVSVAGTLDLSVDGLPNTKVWIFRGNGPANVVMGELTIRVAAPKLLASGTTDGSGNFTFSLPLNANWAGLEGWTQAMTKDPQFGPITGSNAVKTFLVP